MMSPRTGPAPSTAADCLPVDPPAWVYMLRCADGSLYSGWTNDLARRLHAHNGGSHGARYTRAHGGGTLAYALRCTGKSDAMHRETALKKLSKAEKEALAAAWAKENTITIRLAAPEDAETINGLYCWYDSDGWCDWHGYWNYESCGSCGSYENCGNHVLRWRPLQTERSSQQPENPPSAACCG